MVRDCSIPLIFDSHPPLHNMTEHDILPVHMHFSPSVTINARHNEIDLTHDMIEKTESFYSQNTAVSGGRPSGRGRRRAAPW